MRNLHIQVAHDHIEKLTRVPGQNAVMELIWNALDADATQIEIQARDNGVTIDSIVVQDNGNGIKYDEVEQAFGVLGGSVKRSRGHSERKRKLHGKEGQGRFRAFALGDLITFQSVYRDKKATWMFDVHLDANHLQHPQVDDLKGASRTSSIPTGVRVEIHNIHQNSASCFRGAKLRSHIEEHLAVYYSMYPDFSVSLNGVKLDFEGCVRNRQEEHIQVSVEPGVEHQFGIRIYEWTIDTGRKMYLCGATGAAFLELPLGVRSAALPISVYLTSPYIEELQRNNRLQLGEFDPVIQAAIVAARDEARAYLRARQQAQAREYIEELKQEGVYPYSAPAVTPVERAQQQVFDIVALQINEYMPQFTNQDTRGKKFALRLIKQALETDTGSLQVILEEILQLPEEKRNDLRELLEKTSLDTIIDTMKEVTDRLTLIQGLRSILFDPKVRKNVLERKHLHQIVKNETWLFGDDYTLGADDINLKNVLAQYLKDLGRDDFQEVVDSASNEQLEDIPDICLWKQFYLGEAGRKKNMVIELKRPSKAIGDKEIRQIMRYCRSVSNDHRFPKDVTKWVFILLATDLTEEAEFQCEQSNRPWGLIHTVDNCEVWVKSWGRLLQEAEARHQYLKEKLNFSVSSNDEGIALLRQRYAQYLPSDLAEGDADTEGDEDAAEAA